MAGQESEPYQATLSIDERAPVAVNCVRRMKDGNDVLLMWYHDEQPVTGCNATMIYSDQKLTLRFIELEDNNHAGIWQILTVGEA